VLPLVSGGAYGYPEPPSCSSGWSGGAIQRAHNCQSSTLARTYLRPLGQLSVVFRWVGIAGVTPLRRLGQAWATSNMRGAFTVSSSPWPE
jgi:hypothetical protein